MTTTAEERVKQLYRAILYAPDFKDAKALITQALHQAQNDKLEEAARVAEKAFGGPAHTYASENADIYRAQDAACARIASHIRSLKKD